MVCKWLICTRVFPIAASECSSLSVHRKIRKRAPLANAIDAPLFGSFNERMSVRNCRILWGAVMMALFCSCLTARADDEAASRKYPLLSAYIYNFTQFTTFPASASHELFNVCVMGRDPFGATLDPIKNRTVMGKKISVRRYSDTGADVSACNVLFISKSASGDVHAILARLKNAPVLTMSEISGFSDEGGMVEFPSDDGRIGIVIGLPAVKAAGISISSKLLSLANVKG
jgi:hypothetical protein